MVLAHFNRLTTGCPVIMGRKTWDSLPPRFRPRPGRRNLVVTRQPDWRAEGAEPASTLEQALDACARGETPAAEVWVVGGAQLYALAQPLAQRAVVTELEADFGGDAFAPELGPLCLEAERETHLPGTALHFAFGTYLRVTN